MADRLVVRDAGHVLQLHGGLVRRLFGGKVGSAPRE